jgi:hypothetical protein
MKVFPFHNSFDFILLFLKFSPIIPKIFPHQVEPRPRENNNFIYIMDVELEISSRFSILFEICIMVKEQIMYNVISPKILRTQSIQRRYTHARPGTSLWADRGLAKNLFNSYVRLKLYILYLIVSHRDTHIMLEFLLE